MIHILNDARTRIKVKKKYHTSNIFKFINGTGLYFIGGFKTIKNKNGEFIVRMNYQKANNAEHYFTYDFLDGELFTNRFEFVNFDDIEASQEVINEIVSTISLHNTTGLFNTNILGDVVAKISPFQHILDSNMNNLMGIILETRNNGGRDYKAEEEQKLKHEAALEVDREMFGRLGANCILESLEKAKSCDQMFSVTKPSNLFDHQSSDLAKEIDKDILERVLKLGTPKTIILKTHTHKKNNKIVLTEPVELGFDMSPRGYGKDLSSSFRTNAYIGGVDTATFNDTTVLVNKINDAANTISQHSTSSAADFMVTSQYVADQMTNLMGVPSGVLNDCSGNINGYYGSNNIMNSNDCAIGVASNDNTIIISKNKKEINNKVCITEDKLLIL